MKERRIVVFTAGSLALCVISVLVLMILVDSMDKQNHHIYCEILTPGISLYEAKQRLSNIGPYKISGGPRYYYVTFQDTMTYLSLGKMRLFFDNDELVGTARNTSISDWSVPDCQNSR